MIFTLVGLLLVGMVVVWVVGFFRSLGAGSPGAHRNVRSTDTSEEPWRFSATPLDVPDAANDPHARVPAALAHTSYGAAQHGDGPSEASAPDASYASSSSDSASSYDSGSSSASDSGSSGGFDGGSSGGGGSGSDY